MNRALRWFGLLILAVFGFLVAERWRGHHALQAWRQERLAHEETLDPVHLWPKPDERARQFQNRLALVTKAFPSELAAFSGQISGLVLEAPGMARRGSQEPQTPGRNPSSWAQLEAAVRKSATALDDLRQLIKEPPTSLGDDIRQRIEFGGLPNFVGTRVGIQNLEAVVLHELHHGNRESALTNLLALSSFVRLHADEPGLIAFMIRVAIIGSSIDAYWDALQAPGWTEEQLTRLQEAAQIESLLLRIPRVLEAERAMRCASWAWFRSHSYETWIERQEDLGKSFGLKLPGDRFGVPGRLWRAWAFHPLWRFAWADQEELAYLEHTQLDLEGVRDAVRQGSWRQLETHLQMMERDFKQPAAPWRFHGGLPLRDDVFAVIGSGSRQRACPYPDYRRAWQVTFKNLTLHELVMTAIALKRHELRHGKLPATLAALIPDFLPALPHDYMDGQPLRYRLNRDGTFLLYSVGANARDDGGDAIPDTSDTPIDPWNGRDWVWPRLAAAGSPSA